MKRGSPSTLGDWLLGLWVLAAGMAFPAVCSGVLPGFAVELLTWAKCVYVVVVAICLASLALRAARLLNRKQGWSDR